jgi:putative ABC transport system permease protein
MGENVMARTPIWRRYLRFFGPNVGADVRDELRFHIEAKTSELIDQGRSPEEARCEAMRQFGDVTEVSALCRRIGEEQARKIRTADRLADWWYDICHAARSLRREPRFALLAVITLAAGIAGATSLFSVVDAWIIRAVRFPEPRQLIFARSLDTRRGQELNVSFADYQDLRQRSRQFQSLAAWSSTSYALSLADGAERVAGAKVSPNFFSTLSVEPVLGRGFFDYEGEHGRNRVAIVSHGFWKTRLNADPAALGSNLNLDGEPYTVVGVLPERFHLTLAGRANIWTPLAPAPEDRSRRQARFLRLIGRMKPDVAVAQARQELNSIADQLAAAYPDSNLDVGTFCISLSDEIGRHTGEQVVLIVFAVTLGLLLMACSNVANLLLVRSLGRKRQAAIQLSLGASRGRLVRQALVETLSLFFLAAIAGALGGQWFTGLLTQLIPYENRGYLPDYGEASLNWTVLAFVLAVTLLTGLIFGLAPAFENARTNVIAVLKESGSAVSQSPKTKRLRKAFVTAQIVLATILLSTTAILVQGFRSTWSAPMGFESSGVLTFMLALDERQYPDATRRRIFFDSVTEAIRVPQQGAKSAIAQYVPFGGQAGGTSFRLQDQPSTDPRRLPSAGFNAVSPEFFATLRTPVLTGRAFEARDSQGERLVAIVNDAFVSKYLPGKNPIGQSAWLSRMKDRSAEIVGVVAEIREDTDPHRGYPQIYVPFAQEPSADAYLILRPQSIAGAPAKPLELLPEIRRRIAALDPRQPVFDAKTLDERLNEAFAPFRIISGMLVWFGILALTLAAVGVYGVVAFSVSQRTREIGIRAALGAGRATLLRLFLQQGLSILAAGLLPGLLGSLAAGLGLRSMFTDIVSSNLAPPLLFAGAIVGSTVLMATLVPARKAASIDPLLAIRYE